MNNATTSWTIRGLMASTLIAGVVASASATAVYDTSALGELIGSRSAGSGLVIAGGNATSASISWNITYNGGTNRWTYRYSFSENSQQGISHFILDLSDNCSANANCVLNFSDSSTGTDKLVYGTFATSGNPGFPGSIVGVKFDDLSSANPYTFSFESERMPVYGDFYSKGGNGTSNGFAVYNAGAANHASTLTIDFIARPDTVRGPGGATEVPAPASLLLLGAALGGLALGTRRRA